MYYIKNQDGKLFLDSKVSVYIVSTPPGTTKGDNTHFLCNVANEISFTEHTTYATPC